MESITSLIWSNIRRYQLIKPCEKVVLGISGGPDSVALFLILNQLNQKYQQSWKLNIAHLNHQIRGKESDQDERFVKALAKCFRVPIYVERQAISKQISAGNSLETVAREVRYRFLAKVARKVAATTIAVGHTLNDQAETVLMRLIRGCGLRGLSSILLRRQIFTDVSIKLVRPLIVLSRAEIIKFLKDEKQHYRIDSTNLSPRTGLRNRIRLELIPCLERYNPRIKDNLFQIAGIAYETQQYIETSAKKYCPTRGNSIRLSYFRKIPPALRVPVLEAVIKRAKGNLKGITNNHYQTICDLAKTLVLTEIVQNKSPRIMADKKKELDLPDNIRVKIENDCLRFLKTNSTKEGLKRQPFLLPEEIVVPGKICLTRYPFKIETKLYSNKKTYLSRFKRTKTTQEEIFDLDKLRVPLQLKYRQPGDKFQPLGTKGSQSLKKFFIDHKIAKTKRDNVPLITSDDNIIWVVGHRIDDKVKVTSNTKQILKIKVWRLKQCR